MVNSFFSGITKYLKSKGFIKQGFGKIFLICRIENYNLLNGSKSFNAFYDLPKMALKNNTKLKIDIQKIKSLYDDISIYRSNSTIKKYINQRLKGMNLEKKSININKSLNNKRIFYTANKYTNKRKTNFQHTNTSSSTSYVISCPLALRGNPVQLAVQLLSSFRVCGLVTPSFL